MLTHKQIRSAEARDKPYKLPKEQGLYVIVNPNGSKWWRFSYSYAGKEKTLSFGTYPLIPLNLARHRRDEARRLVAQGIDPSAERQASKAALIPAADNRFAAVAGRWEADELSTNSDEYQATIHRLLERDVLPYIGDFDILAIKTPALISVFDRIKQRGVEDTAHRARTVVGQIFRYAIRRGITEIDPTLALKGERRLIPIKHFAAFTNPADVARLLRAIFCYKGSLEVRAALKLHAYLWQRPGEIRTMEWPQIQLESAEWRYVVNKSKRRTGATHIVPLPTQAISILRDLIPLTGSGLELKPEAPRYVLPSPKTRLRPLSENAVRQALRNMGFTNDEMTAHGFRAMARSLLAEQGWTPDAIERQLSHKAAGPLGAAYDRAAFLDERRKMMQAWADYLDALRLGAPVTQVLREMTVAQSRVASGYSEAAAHAPPEKIDAPVGSTAATIRQSVSEVREWRKPYLVQPRATTASPAKHADRSQPAHHSMAGAFREALSFLEQRPNPVG